MSWSTEGLRGASPRPQRGMFQKLNRTRFPSPTEGPRGGYCRPQVNMLLHPTRIRFPWPTGGLRGGPNGSRRCRCLYSNRIRLSWSTEGLRGAPPRPRRGMFQNPNRTRFPSPTEGPRGGYCRPQVSMLLQPTRIRFPWPIGGLRGGPNGLRRRRCLCPNRILLSWPMHWRTSRWQLRAVRTMHIFSHSCAHTIATMKVSLSGTAFITAVNISTHPHTSTATGTDFTIVSSSFAFLRFPYYCFLYSRETIQSDRTISDVLSTKKGFEMFRTCVPSTNKDLPRRP